MMFWILAAVMTVAVTISLLVPLMRPRKKDIDAREFDVEVYSDQLREIERDIKIGSLSGQEAEYARAEVGRRLIKASKAEADHTAASTGLTRFGRLAVIVFLPFMALAGYLAVGQPGMPAQPLATRVAPVPESNSNIQVLVAQAEKHLASNPQDGKGWDVLAPIYLGLNRMHDSETAYRNAIRLLGSTAARQAGLGQSLFSQSGGIVTAEVQEAFQKAQDLQPDNPLSAYFLALGLAQEGKSEQARADFVKLAENSPPDAAWMPLVREHIQRLGTQAGMDQVQAEAAPPSVDVPAVDGPAVDAPGPSAEDVAAASQMSNEERLDMIAGMVAGLDAKLRENPDDSAGWLRLIRSHMVLGQRDQAGDALSRALDHFGADNADRQALLAMASQLGLEPKELKQ
tara:strand:+ start:71651 stop:72850 length:1200 start_codon:yes stop_codon:yes gene_type:complete